MRNFELNEEIKHSGHVSLIVYDKNSNIRERRECKNKITTAGLAMIANQLASSITISKPTYVELGTGQGAASNWYVFTISAMGGSYSLAIGDTYTNNSVTFTTIAVIGASNTTVVMSGSGAPSASGTLTKSTSTNGASTITFSGVSQNCIFTISSGNATVGATYTNGGVTYTVQGTISSGTTLCCSFQGVAALPSPGTLTKSGGTGDATITFSAVIKDIGLLQTYATSTKFSVTSYTSSGAVTNYSYTWTGIAGTFTEVGLFNASGANSLSLHFYEVFAAITVGTSDSIALSTWASTISAT